MFVRACEGLSDKSKKGIESSLKLLISNLLQANNMKTFGVCHSCRFNSKKKEGGYFCNLVQQSLSDDDIQLICREHERKLPSNTACTL